MDALVGEGWNPPPEVKDRVEFHWFHVPHTGSLLLCVLSVCPLWYVGHFHGGRMRACKGSSCDLCALGIGKQLRYLVSVADCRTRQLGVLEVGSGPGMLLRDRAEARGGLRGTVIDVRRAAKSKHSRLEIEVIDEHPGSALLALPALDLREVLTSTWIRAER